MRRFRYEECGLVEYASNGEEVFPTKSDSKRPSMYLIRLMNQVEEGYVGASFQCPVCHNNYKMGFGIFGHIPLNPTFHEVTYWCRDCVRLFTTEFHRR